MGLIVGLHIKFGWGKLINRDSADGEHQLQLMSLYDHVFYFFTCSYMSQSIIDPLGIITLLRNWPWNLEHPHNTGSHLDQLSEITSGPSAGQWQITVETCTVCRIKPPVIDQTLTVWWNSEWYGLQRRWVNWVASASQVSKLWRLNSDHFSLGLMILWLGHLDRAQLGICAPLGFEWGHAVVSRRRCILEGLEATHRSVPWWMDGGWVQLVMPTREDSRGPWQVLQGFCGADLKTQKVPSVGQAAQWRSVSQLQKLQRMRLWSCPFHPLNARSEHAVLLLISTPTPISGQDVCFNLF